MCVNKVYVRDLLRRSRIGTYYNCGKCAACRQASANRRARRIKQHHPDGMTCYFVTLSYKHECVPYILKSEVLSGQFDLKDHAIDTQYLNVYRDFDPYNTDEIYDPVIAQVAIDRTYTDYELDKLSFIYHNKAFVPDKVSVCFSADIQKFFKRFRQALFRHYGEVIPVSYYYAPEYGPTHQRYHSHLLIWCPAKISLPKIRSFIISTWAYADFDKLDDDKWCDYTKCASNYVASYVNCSSDLSQFLYNEFRSKPSHSLGFGFDNEHFELRSILSQLKNERSVTYSVPVKATNGLPTFVDIPYPQYVAYRYFPKIKGFNRIATNSLFHFYLHLEEYLTLNHFNFYTSETGVKFYSSQIRDRNNCFVFFSDNEANYFIKRFYRSWSFYQSVYPENTICEFIEDIIDYYTCHASNCYHLSQSSIFPLDNVYQFYNLLDIRKRPFLNFGTSFIPFISSIDDYHLDPNEFPTEILRTQDLINKYNKNIKQRKINCL